METGEESGAPRGSGKGEGGGFAGVGCGEEGGYQAALCAHRLPPESVRSLPGRHLEDGHLPDGWFLTKTPLTIIILYYY